MVNRIVSKKLKVNGIVQGVGFRPFVFQLADTHDLNGQVSNTSAGVSIHIEGRSDNVDAFEIDLTEKSPPLAVIVEIAAELQPVNNYTEFSIVESQDGAAMATLISPDVSICDDCLREMLDPGDRRFHYPFINCTNCGPRYTIIDDIPYDRPKTSMRCFDMCPQCQAEYDTPTDRRFHAQPNACPACGPQVALFDNRRNEIRCDDPVAQTATLLKQGYIIAVKGLGGYHLAADAENSEAVARLRKRKLREEKPFATMSANLEDIRSYAVVEPDEAKLLSSIQRPIVLLKKKNPSIISDDVAPRNKYFGVMLPYTPLHYLLLEYGFKALVMTSGNLSEEPIAIDNEDAFSRLADIADFLLVHNRGIYLRSDDSIVRSIGGRRQFIRRSRGFVPIPVFLKKEIPPILACGAELKNTVCVTRGNQAFLSQHIGDLENMATYEFMQLTIDHMKRILGITPEIIACDLHPDYLSTRYAGEQTDIQKMQVQHHHAHIVSCMAEHKLEGPLIGLSFDGTGYGTDGSIWGGEVLIAEEHAFERGAHLAYIPMPGSAAAIKEPWRMAVSYLQDAYGAGFRDLDLPFLRSIESEKLTLITQMIDKRLNTPLTSSLGRLFDGVAAIADIRSHINFEGQAAMELEMLAADAADRIYDYEWESAEGLRILPAPIIRGVVGDIQAGEPLAVISARFHQTLIRLFADLCDTIRGQRGIDQVVMSGGVFQNQTLLTGLMKTLAENKFKVYTHEQIPCNDGGIALGQAVIAAAVSKRR